MAPTIHSSAIFRLFSLERVIGHNDRIRATPFLRTFSSTWVYIVSVLESLVVWRCPALYSFFRSTRHTQLKNTIKLFLATLLDLRTPRETEVKGFRRFRVVIYFRPRGFSLECVARVTTKENYLLESRQCVVLGPRLFPSSRSILLLSFHRFSFASLLLPPEIFPSFPGNVRVVCFATLSPQIRMRNQSPVKSIKNLAWESLFLEQRCSRSNFWS